MTGSYQMVNRPRRAVRDRHPGVLARQPELQADAELETMRNLKIVMTEGILPLVVPAQAGPIMPVDILKCEAGVFIERPVVMGPGLRRDDHAWTPCSYAAALFDAGFLRGELRRTEEQNSQVTTTLPFSTMSARSSPRSWPAFRPPPRANRCTAPLPAAPDRPARRARGTDGTAARSPDRSGSSSSTSSMVANSDWPSVQASSSSTMCGVLPSGASPGVQIGLPCPLRRFRQKLHQHAAATPAMFRPVPTAEFLADRKPHAGRNLSGRRKYSCAASSRLPPSSANQTLIAAHIRDPDRWSWRDDHAPAAPPKSIPGAMREAS
ncbi:hypothetical protein SFIMM107S_00530 [Streptomyces griseus]